MRIFWLVLLTLTSHLYAQISPGKLSRFHAALEGLNNCTQCHELGKEVTDTKCLACHTAIEERRKAGKGYHASADVKSQRCAKCHGEHYGREFELIFWKDGREKFDHSLTGYPLVGAHARQKCQACHTSSYHSEASLALDSTTNRAQTFLGLTPACISCHADEHGDQLTNDCASCHNSEKWSPAPQFSHDKSKYRLTGKHAETACVKCHKAELVESAQANRIPDPVHPAERTKYQGLEFSSCKSCHNDVHQGKFGINCSGCHTTESFAVARMAADFDHNKTGFPLTGKHIGVDCAKCHTSGKLTDPVAHAACKDCHKDEHRGQFADRTDKGACETCHTVDGFVPARYGIAEHAESIFPLAGGHLATPCIACHTATLSDKAGTYAKFAFADRTCEGCHTDVHRGQLDKYMQNGSCEFCHSVESWRTITFDHASTGFPLVGKHDQTACMGCHVRERTETDEQLIRMSPLARECELCHADPHRAQFVIEPLSEIKINCKRCHTSEAWNVLAFDHNRDARWALDGAHQKVACNSCHKSQSDSEGNFVVYRPLASACTDCHGGATPSKP